MIFPGRALKKIGKIRQDNKIVWIASSMLFFWAIFDGILSYIVPLVITESGFNESQMGMILATSSLAGAIFDFIFSRFVTNLNYRRLFLVVYILCLIFPLSLWLSHTVILFVGSMIVWGIYYDIVNFASYNLLKKHTELNEHCLKSGIIMMFKSFGGLIAPIIAGLLVTDIVTHKPYLYSILFLTFSLIFFVLLIKLSRHSPKENADQDFSPRRDFLSEIKVWVKVDSFLLPVILFNTFLFIHEAFFWTVGPLFSEKYPNFPDFGGILMAVFLLPFLFTGWFVEKITSRLGKKKTAYYSLLISSFILFFIYLFPNPWYVLAIVFSSSIFVSISQVAIQGAFIDYVTESRNVEKEIEGSDDFTSNLGYVIGPIFAGFVAHSVGVQASFSVLALMIVISVCFLFFITPAHIQVKVPNA